MALTPEQIEFLRVAKAGLIRHNGTIIQRWSAHAPSSDVTAKAAPLIGEYLEATVSGHYFPTLAGEAELIAVDRARADQALKRRREMVVASRPYGVRR